MMMRGRRGWRQGSAATETNQYVVCGTKLHVVAPSQQHKQQHAKQQLQQQCNLAEVLLEAFS